MEIVHFFIQPLPKGNFWDIINPMKNNEKECFIMKRALSILLIALLSMSAFFAVGCGDDSKDESSSPDASSDASETSNDSTPTGKKLRIASYNIAHVGQYNFTKENYDELARIINSQDLDIVGLQEAVVGIFGKGGANERFTDSLAELMSRTGHKYAYYLGWDDPSNTGWGILSKYPIANIDKGSIVNAPIEYISTAGDHYYNENEKNTVPNLNLSSTKGSNLIEFDIDGEPLNFWVTHTSPAKFETAFGHITAEEENFIMLGDFNNPAFTDLSDFVLSNGKTLGSNMSLVNNEENKMITFPRDQKFMDNILYTTDDFRLLDSGVVETESTVSDHFLIWAEFEFSVK